MINGKQSLNSCVIGLISQLLLKLYKINWTYGIYDDSVCNLFEARWKVLSVDDKAISG